MQESIYLAEDYLVLFFHSFGFSSLSHIKTYLRFTFGARILKGIKEAFHLHVTVVWSELFSKWKPADK